MWESGYRSKMVKLGVWFVFTKVLWRVGKMWKGRDEGLVYVYEGALEGWEDVEGEG